MTKVLRSMPRTCFPYIIFCFMTPNCRQTASSGSEQLERELHLFLEALVRLQRVAGDAEDLAAGALEGAVLVAEVRALGAAAGRVVLRIEVQCELAAAERGEVKRAAAGGGETEVGDRLSQHFQWS